MQWLWRMHHRIGVRGVIQRLLLRRQVGIDQTWQSFSHDLRCLLLRLLFRCLRTFECFARRHILCLIGRKARFDGGDDQDFIETVEVRGGFDENPDESILIWILHYFVHYADWQTARKNLIAAGRQDSFPGLDTAIGHQTHDLRLADGVAAKNAPDARGLENHAGAAALVVDHEHLCRTGIHFANLAHNAVGSYDCHIAVEYGFGALVDVKEPRLIAAARADDLRGLGFVDVLFLKI